MFTLTQSNLATIFAVGKDSIGPYSLSNLRADTENKKIYASNGHSLYRSEMGESQDLEHDGPEVFLPAVLVTKAEKNAKKGESIEVYSTDKNTRLSVDHGKSQDVVRFEKEEGMKYPAVEEIFGMFKTEPVAQTVIGLAELEILVKVAKKAGAGSVRLKLRGREDAVEVVIEKAGIDGVIMPYRLSTDEIEEREQKRRAAKELA